MTGPHSRTPSQRLPSSSLISKERPCGWFAAPLPRSKGTAVYLLFQAYAVLILTPASGSRFSSFSPPELSTNTFTLPRRLKARKSWSSFHAVTRELHTFGADRGRGPALLGFERLPGGFLGIAVEFVQPAFPISVSIC